MPEPLNDDYLLEVQGRVTDARPGKWDITLDNDGMPQGFGPFASVEPWALGEAVPNMQFCAHARKDIPALLGEVARLRTRITELEQQSYGPALPWAARMDADDLEGFFADLEHAAAGDDDLTTLQNIEKTITTWRLIGEATYAQRTAPGPGGTDAH
ncbi:hypothetical protein AB0M87_04815 [Streptomyces sp. NPDC051320]|uniref:hypothetical protein n=1 Tax=Streptomyces sp. NPDC051320 TaxID=3154644 RepID=UPI00342E7F25